MQENLQDMVKNLNSSPIIIKGDPTDKKDDPTEGKGPSDVKEPVSINITNFFDWFENNTSLITGCSRVKAEVSKVKAEDSIILKVPKKGNKEEMELISFYNPKMRPVLDLPPVYLKVFRNDTFITLHTYSDEIFIKSYGVKNGLIVVYCANIDGRVVPYHKIKLKKNVISLHIANYENVVKEIKDRLNEDVNSEDIQLLYKQAIKYIDQFTTKESALNWFLKKQEEVNDINHLLKIDNVLIHII